MKKLLAALCLCTSALAGWAAPVSLAFSLSPHEFFFLPHANGSIEVDAYPVFAPISISKGDQLTVNIDFAEARAYLRDISPLNSGIEAVTLSLHPFDSSLFAGALVTVDLLGVQGDLVTGRIFDGAIGFNGGIAWQVAKNLTDSEFSFSGIRYQFNFIDQNKSFELTSGLFGFYGGAIRFEPVPEPTSPLLFLIGLAAVALVRSRSS